VKFASPLVTLSFLLATPYTVIRAEESSAADLYRFQPGDALQLSVWTEEELNREVVVRPDGRINFPLVGEAQSSGSDVEDLHKLIATKLTKYIPDTVVAVSIQQLSGNIVYVIGKVSGPGQFPILRNAYVMQALNMAGGPSIYAALNKIKILRSENGTVKAIPFEDGEVEKSKSLEQNVDVLLDTWDKPVLFNNSLEYGSKLSQKLYSLAPQSFA
jgi:polysaccharide export outer membrane protein